MSIALIWFRQDLRCEDNPALALACKKHKYLIPLYIKESEPALALGAAQQWWLHHSLEALQRDLQQVGLDLHFKSGNVLSILQELINEYGIDAVYWNRCYEPQQRARDQEIKTQLKQQGLEVVSCNGSLLHEPWQVLNKSGEFFKVFTPYWRQCLKQIEVRSLLSIEHWPQLKPITGDTLDMWQLLPSKPDWAEQFGNHWQPGAAGAALKLSQFLDDTLSGYKQSRNEPGVYGTSRLSPHLHFGEISPQQVWFALQQAMHKPDCDLASAETFLAELGWREFSYQLLYHVPQLAEQNFKAQFDHFPWQNDHAALKLWQRGLTGYPLVDAGMRELWQSGYMHNRVRMIVASFLTKDLMIDWRLGAAWFWYTLLDADLANNSASWQWVAGSGADAAPYYRVFNPVLQGEKFDPLGDYVKRWVPELAEVPSQWLHHPWDAPKGCLPITLGVDYPLPIVDHAHARALALSAYKQLKQP